MHGPPGRPDSDEGCSSGQILQTPGLARHVSERKLGQLLVWFRPETFRNLLARVRLFSPHLPCFIGSTHLRPQCSRHIPLIIPELAASHLRLCEACLVHQLVIRQRVSVVAIQDGKARTAGPVHPHEPTVCRGCGDLSSHLLHQLWTFQLSRCGEHFGNNVAIHQIEAGLGIGDVIRASIRVSAVSRALLHLKLPGFLERCHSKFRPDFALQEKLRPLTDPRLGYSASSASLTSDSNSASTSFSDRAPSRSTNFFHP